tara:strand:+ start:333 stop:512 length:180 start_codon:yes stop_codon:yes gene_type:complete
MVTQEVYCVFEKDKGRLMGIYGSRKSAREARKGYVKFFNEHGRDVKTDHFKIESKLMFD